MKRLFPVFALAALIAMSLVSCKQNEVKLHEQVGAIYNPESATETMGGDGIVFYVDEDGGYALVCSMNDVKQDLQTSSSRDHRWESNFTWSVFGTDTVMERDTIWADVTRSIRHFVERVDYDTTISGKENHFFKYNFETKDTNLRIYPMLRYKAYTEKGDQVLPPFTKDTMFFGFIGELIPADTIVQRIDTMHKLIYDTIIPRDSVFPGETEGVMDTIKLYDTINQRDTIVRIDTIYRGMAARYADTLWCGVKSGDIMRLGSDNKGLYALDTNWSFSLIPGLGEDDPDGFENTKKIMAADVPCRQKATPDSSSAARTCREYYTQAYNNKRDLDSIDIRGFKAVTYAEENESMRWYLPSRDELRKLFDARNRINEMNANTLGFEPLQNCYWSSNQRDAQNAWYKCFSDNGVESYIPKANTSYRVNVRAVRKVQWPLK